MEISEEFYEHVDKVAKSASYKWEDLDWEDIRQDMWVHFLERPNEMTKILEDDKDIRDKKLRRVATQVCVAEVHGYEQWSGQYVYGKDEVKALLRAGALLDCSLGTLTERTDLSLAMEALKDTNPSYFSLLVDNYVHNKAMTQAQFKTIVKALTKLTLLMNQIHNMQEYSYHDGVGARTVLSNSTSLVITGEWG